jgi:hypothetical protein
VGSPETVSQALLDYVDLGATLISIRGYDNFNDAVDYGRYILPRVREGIKEREEKAPEKLPEKTLEVMAHKSIEEVVEAEKFPEKLPEAVEEKPVEKPVEELKPYEKGIGHTLSVIDFRVL